MNFGFTDVIINLEGLKANNPQPILREHDPTKIVGVSDTVEKDSKNRLHVSGYMLDTKDAKDVADLADQKFPWQASIGVQFLDAEYIEEDKMVNGKKEKAPFIEVTSSLVRETSFVVLGRDSRTRAVVLSEYGHLTIEKEDGVDERERVLALLEEFPTEFAQEHIKLGSSVLEAKAAYADFLKAEMEKKKIEEYQPTVPSATDTEQESFEQLTARFRSQGLSKWDAIRKVAVEYPEVHQAYLERVNGR